MLLAKTDANNAAVTYAYDLAGRRSTRTWARGVVTTYAYDPATGDLTGTTYSDGTPAVSNTYDRRGRLATVVDGSGSRSFTYTASGQVADETITYTGEPARTLLSAYDAWSRRTSFAGGSAVGYSPTTGLPSLAGMAYLPNPALPAVAPNGTAFAWSATRDSLSEADNLWGATDWHFTYARDALSRITQQTLDLDSGQSVTVRPFGYNARSEVTVSTAESYAYDAQGNRTAGNGQGYTPNALNQYTVVGAATWTYDADGNLTSDGVRTFAYDGENRLKQAAGFTFTYDYRHRVAKQTGTWRPWGGWSYGAAGIAHRYYDGAKVVYRRDVCGGYTQEAGYAWGPDLAGRVVGGDGTGGLASVYSNGRTYYPIHDGRGNIWGFTESGVPVITRSLTTFGDGAFNPYQNVPVYVPVSLLGFAHGTKEFIPALGLYLFGRRFYDPKTGRFLNRDPIAEDGSLNLYRFVSNNPVNSWDYNGLFWVQEFTRLAGGMIHVNLRLDLEGTEEVLQLSESEYGEIRDIIGLDLEALLASPFVVDPNITWDAIFAGFPTLRLWWFSDAQPATLPGISSLLEWIRGRRTRCDRLFEQHAALLTPGATFSTVAEAFLNGAFTAARTGGALMEGSYDSATGRWHYANVGQRDRFFDWEYTWAVHDAGGGFRATSATTSGSPSRVQLDANPGIQRWQTPHPELVAIGHNHPVVSPWTGGHSSLSPQDWQAARPYGQPFYVIGLADGSVSSLTPSRSDAGVTHWAESSVSLPGISQQEIHEVLECIRAQQD